jgi:hypothetical protein
MSGAGDTTRKPSGLKIGRSVLISVDLCFELFTEEN